MILLPGPLAHAQDSLKISKNPNFSTADNVFTFNETRYAKVTSPRIDYTGLDKNEFRLKPVSDGSEVKGAFTNLFNGTYTTAIALSPLDRLQSNWEFEVEIKDRQGNEFKTRVNLTIQDNPPPVIVELEGQIEALAANFLKLSGQTIFVDAATSVTEFGRALKFTD
jgi:hypothetical protein